VLSDRFDRRLLVIATHIVSGLCAAGLAVLTLAGMATEVDVIATAFAINTSYAIAKPALSSVIPDLVPRDELQDAVGLNSLQFISGQLLGPIIAAGVIAFAGAGPAFAINAVTYIGPILAMAYLLRKRLGGTAVDHRGGSAAERGPGMWEYVRGHPWVLSLLIGVLATSSTLEIVRTLSPVLAVRAFGAPESAAGLLVAAQSAGSAVGLMLFVPLRRRGLSRVMAAAGMGLQSAGLLGAVAAPQLVMAAPAVALIGLGFSLCFPVLTGLLQAEAPDEVRGRIMALHTLFHLGNRPFAALAIGTLASLVGAHPALLGGLALAPVGLFAQRAAWRQLRITPPVAEPDLAAVSAGAD
jgi:Transmembrane secretion effector